MGPPRTPPRRTHRRSAPGLYEPVVEGERLHDGGVGLGALLKLLQRQLPICVLQNTPVTALLRPGEGDAEHPWTEHPWTEHPGVPAAPTPSRTAARVPPTAAASVSPSNHPRLQPGKGAIEGAMTSQGS